VPITTARCPVLKADVTRVSDFEGLSTAIICAEFDKPGGICRLKKNALDEGPLCNSSSVWRRVRSGIAARDAI